MSCTRPDLDFDALDAEDRRLMRRDRRVALVLVLVTLAIVAAGAFT